MSDTKTLRLEVRFKNARLYNAIAERSVPLTKRAGKMWRKGAGPIKAFCDLHGFQPTTVYALLTLNHKPWTKKEQWRDIALRIAAILEADPAWLFPRDLYDANFQPIVGETNHTTFLPLASAPRQALLTEGSQERDVDRNELEELMSGVLCTLTPREERVIRGLYFDDKTVEDIGQELGVVRQRVAQISAKALRKLRHPSRSRQLRPFLETL